eukprot:16433894-Heterocapsa_arctica.AAC.1
MSDTGTVQPGASAQDALHGCTPSAVSAPVWALGRLWGSGMLHRSESEGSQAIVKVQGMGGYW